MFRNFSIVCRQINSIQKINCYRGHPCLLQKYHDVSKSFASNVNHPLEVLDLIPCEPNALSTTDISRIFRDLQRTHTQNPCDWSTIQNHKNFPILCESLKCSLSTVQIPSSSDYVAILRNLGLPVEHELTQSILRVILHLVSTLSLDDIFTMDHLIRESYDRSSPNALHKNLLLILPTVFEINYLDQIDCVDVEKLCSSLNFIANNFKRMPQRAIAIVVTSLRMCGENIGKTHAIQIITALSKQNCMDSHIEPLLHKCIHMLVDAPLTHKEIEILLNCLSRFDVKVDCCDEKFFEKCVQRLIHDDCDVVIACSISKKFAELKFTSIALLEFICRKVDNHSNRLPVYETLGLIMDLSKAKYKPFNWDAVILPMIKDLQFNEYVEELEKVNWPRIATSLIQLGHYDALLIEKIMESDKKQNSRWFRKLKYLCRNERFSFIGQMLKRSIGDSLVLADVLAQDHFRINYVLKIDCQTGKFTPFAEHECRNDDISLNKIHSEANELLIGIIPTDSSIWQKLMSLNLAIVPIDVKKWNAMPEYMKMTEIFSKITKHIKIYQDKMETKQRDGN